MECRDPIDLLDHHQKWKIQLCWYEKEPTMSRLYNLTDHLMVILTTIIALASMKYVVDLDAYELHPGYV